MYTVEAAISQLQAQIAENRHNIDTEVAHLGRLAANGAGYWAKQEVKDEIRSLYETNSRLQRQLNELDY